jgi:hypothetical protein
MYHHPYTAAVSVGPPTSQHNVSEGDWEIYEGRNLNGNRHRLTPEYDPQRSDALVF